MAYLMPSKSPTSAGLPASSSGPAGGGKKSSAKGSWLKGLITLILVLAVIGGGIYWIACFTGVGGGLLSRPLLKADWQAVFLTNGQVYFGKIVKLDKSFLTIKNIYYLQVVEQPLQTSQTGQAADQPVQPQTEQRLTLIKLGNEIHGPTDQMVINRDQVVLLEDLKNDSRVVQSINEYLTSTAAEKK